MDWKFWQHGFRERVATLRAANAALATELSAAQLRASAAEKRVHELEMQLADRFEGRRKVADTLCQHLRNVEYDINRLVNS